MVGSGGRENIYICICSCMLMKLWKAMCEIDDHGYLEQRWELRGWGIGVGERLFAVYIFIYSIYKPFECIIYSKIRLKKDKLRS